MRLEDQVPSLELSNKLKELGVKQESLFYWVNFKDSGVISAWYSSEINIEKGNIEIICSAFTVAELGEMLPKLTVSCLTLNGKKEESAACYLDTSLESKRVYKMADTEANARAEMLIYLLEKKLISL